MDARQEVVDEIWAEVRGHIDVLAHPTITKSVFNDVAEIRDDPFAALPTTHARCRSLRITYPNGEQYDILVVPTQ